MKTAIVVSGLHPRVLTKPYESIGNLFKNAGYETLIHYPNWEATDPVLWQEDLVKIIDNTIGDITLLGFSMGGMISLLVSRNIEVENLILCSPSGYFKEYVHLLTPDDLDWARKHISRFEDLSAIETLRASKPRNGFIVAGEAELSDWPDFRQWISDLELQTKWTSVIIPKTGHEIESQAYQAEIADIIASL